MRRSFPGHLIPQREFHGLIDRQRGKMHVIFVIEHYLLAVLAGSLVVHAAIVGFTNYLIKGIAVVG